MAGFNRRETRKVKMAGLIESNYVKGDRFSVHDIERLWNRKWKHSLTVREIAKILPMLDLDFEREKGVYHKIYIYDGTIPLYTRRRDPYEDLE